MEERYRGPRPRRCYKSRPRGIYSGGGGGVGGGRGRGTTEKTLSSFHTLPVLGTGLSGKIGVRSRPGAGAVRNFGGEGVEPEIDSRRVGNSGRATRERDETDFLDGKYGLSSGQRVKLRPTTPYLHDPLRSRIQRSKRVVDSARSVGLWSTF